LAKGAGSFPFRTFRQRRTAREGSSRSLVIRSIAMEFILVRFDPADIRDVIANGSVIGKTEKTLMLDTGFFEITLSGAGFTPKTWEGAIDATIRSNPMPIRFTPVAAANKGAAAAGRKTKAKPSTKRPKKRGSAGV
jgi:hypothetical protein